MVAVPDLNQDVMGVQVEILRVCFTRGHSHESEGPVTHSSHTVGRLLQRSWLNQVPPRQLPRQLGLGLVEIFFVFGEGTYPKR